MDTGSAIRLIRKIDSSLSIEELSSFAKYLGSFFTFEIGAWRAFEEIVASSSEEQKMEWAASIRRIASVEFQHKDSQAGSIVSLIAQVYDRVKDSPPAARPNEPMIEFPNLGGFIESEVDTWRFETVFGVGA